MTFASPLLLLPLPLLSLFPILIVVIRRKRDVTASSALLLRSEFAQPSCARVCVCMCVLCRIGGGGGVEQAKDEEG
jgi:uncharacterized membrane protein YhaH (DUF805 family)